MKKLFLSSIIAILTLNTTACTDDQVAASLGAVAIGAAAGAIIANGGLRCEGGYETRCTSYRDYWGYYRSDCRQVYDSCAHLRSKAVSSDLVAELGVEAVETTPSQDEVVNDVNFGDTFNIGYDGAGKFIKAMKLAQVGDASGLKEFNLSRKDVQYLALRTLPTQQGVQNIAKALNQDILSTRAMLLKLLAYAQ